MTIDDIEIIFKKCDEKSQTMIFNILVLNIIEIRGYTARFVQPKKSAYPVWVVNPPAIIKRNKKYFWIAKIKNSELWDQLKARIQKHAEDYKREL